jgi:hypothetical protein
LNGVGEREVAFLHDSGLLTVEGDETSYHDAESELEFVTAPLPDAATARRVFNYARTFAGDLATIAQTAKDRTVTFEAGASFGGGKWLKACTVQVGDGNFGAQAQVTVGVPLAGLATFVRTVLERTGYEDKLLMVEARLEASQTILQKPSNGKPSDAVVGFLAACHMFLIQATYVPLDVFSVTPDGLQSSKGVHGKIYDLSDLRYIRDLRFPAPPQPGEQQTSFAVRPRGSHEDRYLVVVDIDSPKSMFPALHRTDFRAMFHALSATDKASLRAAGVDVIWPDRDLLGDPASTYLFPYPYRADPAAADAEERAGQGLAFRRAEWLDGATRPTSATDWHLVVHGPSVSDWWDSVQFGDGLRRGPGKPAGRLAKDVASPPPGWRGRAPERIHEFPTSAENKNDYYGMGAFPMDSPENPQLAVFEVRSLMSDTGVVDLIKGSSSEGLVSRELWGKLLDLVLTHYVP